MENNQRKLVANAVISGLRTCQIPRRRCLSYVDGALAAHATPLRYAQVLRLLAATVFFQAGRADGRESAAHRRLRPDGRTGLAVAAVVSGSVTGEPAAGVAMRDTYTAATPLRCFAARWLGCIYAS